MLFQTASHPVFQLLAQMAHVCLHSRKWVHTRLRSKNRTQGHTRRNTGRFGWGVVSLPSERSARSRTSPGRVPERRILPLLGLDRVCSQRTQRAFGTAMRLCASLSRGVAAPLGCVIFSVSVEIAACMPCAQGLSVCARRGVVSLPSARFTCCRNAGRPLVKTAHLPFSEVGWSSLIPAAQKQKQHLTANSPGSL